MADDKSQPSKCFFDMWQQQQQEVGGALPQNHRLRKFEVHIRVNFVVEYLPHHCHMNVRSEKTRFLLEGSDLVGDDDDKSNLKVRETMSTLLKDAAPVSESELERIAKIVSLKAKLMDADSCNVGRDVISIVMSLRVVYLREYTQEVELSWAARLRTGGPELLKRRMPALDSAVGGLGYLDKVVYDMGSCSEEQCSICLVGFNVGEEIRRTPCVHDFHETCISNWFKRSHLCPLCRFPLPVCDNTEALCPFKSERPCRHSHRVYRKPRMHTRAPWARSHVFGRLTIVDPIN